MFNWGCATSNCHLETSEMYRNAWGPKQLAISWDVQTISKFLIIRIGPLSKSYRLPANLEIGEIHCSISKNHTIFCRHVDHKCYYEAKLIGM